MDPRPALCICIRPLVQSLRHLSLYRWSRNGDAYSLAYLQKQVEQEIGPRTSHNRILISVTTPVGTTVSERVFRVLP